MTEPNKAIPMGTPTMKLAGKEWPVPPLAIKQLRIIVPASTVIGELRKGQGVSKTQMDAILNVVHTALTRAHPGFPVDEFEEMDITLPELMEAVPTILEATGMRREAKEGTAPGEAPAGS